MTLQIPFDNSYARLPERFYVRQPPVPVARPELVLLNRVLATDLGIDPAALQSDEGIAVLSGNAVAMGSEPLAQAYSGHQFGGFSPVLGDGRALLLGEVMDRRGRRRDIQLKGSGRTAFSRPGSDGRSPLGPAIREFIVSEAMHALGIPTTRSLAVVATGESVRRNGPEPGGVLTRIAASHLRIGTFQFFAVRQDIEALRLLADFAIVRHFPEAEGPLDLLNAVIARQADLVARWMGAGFIHGVMNTDNTAISGETIDYGPCAFMDEYHPQTVFSSIDRHGRYAFDRQAGVLAWNLAQFASCLVPLLDRDTDTAVRIAQGAVGAYPALVERSWGAVFAAKLGLAEIRGGDDTLAVELLDLMARQQADFTNTFRGLADGSAGAQFTDPAPFDTWESRWRQRVAQGAAPEAVAARLRAANPAIVPRNHRVAEAISAAEAGDLAPVHRLIAALRTPFASPDTATHALTKPPADDERVRQTFCGT
ncbi:protein adenylyltransferase SelO [Tropicimonas sp.]|uniref:protein adenylyltransferase SelO n=1 Tax=Tropicimonas sp. TaxID=2067044 RepID=UPI003A88EAE4